MSISPTFDSLTVNGSVISSSLSNGSGTGTVATHSGAIIVGNSNTNHLTIGAGNGNQIIASGSGNVNVTVQPQGSGSFLINNGNGGSILAVTGNASSIANSLTLQGGTSNNPVTLASSSWIRPSSPMNIQFTGTWSGSSSAPVNLMPLSVVTTMGGTSSAPSFQLHEIQCFDGIVGTMNKAHNLLFLDIEAQSGMVGWPQAILAQVNQAATTGNSGAGGFYNAVAGEFVCTASHPEGGTAVSVSTSSGTIFGLNPEVYLQSGATGFTELCGMETNIAAATGSSVFVKYGITLTPLSSDQVPGFGGVDALVTLTGQPGAGAIWSYGIQFGNEGGSWNFNGTLIGSRLSGSAGSPTPGTAVWDIDFLANTASSGLIRGNGFQVAGDGTARIGLGSVKPEAAGMAIDTDGFQASTATIAAGGAGYSSGWYVLDVLGNIWEITGVSGGAITSVSIYRAVQTTSQTTTANIAALPYVPTATGATLTISYSSGTTLQLQPSGGTVQLGSGAFTANGSTSVSLTSIAPSGAHATVQEWLTIKDAGGTTRYIPCF